MIRDPDALDSLRWRAEGNLSSLTETMERRLGDRWTTSGQTPEEILLAREAIEDQEAVRRKLSPEMLRALAWIGSEKPERVWRLVDWALPLAEAYMLRRYLLSGDTSTEIAGVMGVTGAAVRYRLHRAIWRLRVVQDLAWDIPLETLRESLRGLLPRRFISVVVAMWAARFSQSMAAKSLRDWQGSVRRRIAIVVDRLKEPAKTRKDVARIRDTLLELQRRKLWFLATPQATKGKSLRMPVDGGRAA